MLLCDVSGDFITKTLYFFTESKYTQYFSIRSDSFLVALLPYIMARSSENGKIECIIEGELSERLYYQIIHHFVPCMARNASYYSDFALTCKNIVNIPDISENAVGTGVSGGVDSFCTLIQSKTEFPEKYKITHGLTWFATNKFDTELGNAEKSSVKKICSYFGIEPVLMHSNIIPDFYECGHEAVITCANAAFFLSLSKLFHICYISSSQTYENTAINAAAMEEADLFCAYTFSHQNTTFYVTGATMSRAEKTEFISKDDFVMENLYTCRNPIIKDGKNCNCSKCSKDTRTMLDLEIIGKLSICKSYNYEAFRKNPLYFWGYLYYQPKDSLYRQGTEKLAKQKKYKIPFLSRLSGLFKILKNKGHRVNPYKYSFRP